MELPILKKLIPIHYAEPEVKDMAIIIVFYNPGSSIRIIQNLLYVRNMLRKFPLYIGELAFGDTPFELEASENVIQFRSDSYMFYKENLIKCVEKHIPEKYTKIMTMDADVVYDNPRWYYIISNGLDRLEVIHGFCKASWLNMNFTPTYLDKTLLEPGLCIRISCLLERNYPVKHPGFAWAFRRQWFKKYYVFDYAVIGAGDDVLANIIMNNNNNLPGVSYYANDLDKIEKVEDCVAGAAALVLYHLPHGSRLNRAYISRHALLAELLERFKITRISEALIRREDGILEWKPEYKEEFNKTLRQYFIDRQDDGI